MRIVFVNKVNNLKKYKSYKTQKSQQLLNELKVRRDPYSLPYQSCVFVLISDVVRTTHGSWSRTTGVIKPWSRQQTPAGPFNVFPTTESPVKCTLCCTCTDCASIKPKLDEDAQKCFKLSVQCRHVPPGPMQLSQHDATSCLSAKDDGALLWGGHWMRSRHPEPRLPEKHQFLKRSILMTLFVHTQNPCSSCPAHFNQQNPFMLHFYSNSSVFPFADGYICCYSRTFSVFASRFGFKPFQPEL